MAYKKPDDYVEVAERIIEFRTKYPNGSLQQHDIRFGEIAGTAWVVYTAAAYRTPDDIRPGMGTAWEPIPGKTPYTKDSEVQNAETAAWGRAIVAALAADTKKGIASREEVRNRQAERAVDEQDAAEVTPEAARLYLAGWAKKKGITPQAIAAEWDKTHDVPLGQCEDVDALRAFYEDITRRVEEES